MGYVGFIMVHENGAQTPFVFAVRESPGHIGETVTAINGTIHQRGTKAVFLTEEESDADAWRDILQAEIERVRTVVLEAQLESSQTGDADKYLKTLVGADV